uniref:Holocytochrome c-type synthase n=1 Tax=Erythrolobus australicus TaxID=1077150 RepID=A0A7S1TL80_9RHOD|mmetsp:Transcript_2036/g.5427  ORF Transcript_2036/g.5427 Transcript_2036/m.5427 type:complete len:466 (+) Transcript_2036:51-1448(+)
MGAASSNLRSASDGAAASPANASSGVSETATANGAAADERQTTEAVPASRCPVPLDKRHKIFDVYSRPVAKQPSASEASAPSRDPDALNPSNMMPAVANNLPSPKQAKPLSVERQISSIPKDLPAAAQDGAALEEEAEKWVYPSPQMFYNALARKGKADGVAEEDMDTVVMIHNNMNERTWREILDQWESRFHGCECAHPALRRFRGRPDELSPMARFRTLVMRQDAPFDRHDWIVDRCGTEARYIIDYYYTEPAPGAPHADPICIDVRPALDSPQAVWDRLRHRGWAIRDAVWGAPSARPDQNAASRDAASATASTYVQAETLEGGTAPTAMRQDVVLDEKEFKFLSTLDGVKLKSISEQVHSKCSQSFELVQRACAAPESAQCEQAQLGLSYCMASVVCPDAANAFMSAMQRGEGEEAAAFSQMTACVDRFHVVAARVARQEAGIYPLGPEQLPVPPQMRNAQ